jgi:hypothetical protein
MNIKVQIEQLILEGLPVTRAQGPAVLQSAETELARLFSTHGLAPSLRTGGATPEVPAGTLPLAAGTHPQPLGKQIALEVFRRISK